MTASSQSGYWQKVSFPFMANASRWPASNALKGKEEPPHNCSAVKPERRCSESSGQIPGTVSLSAVSPTFIRSEIIKGLETA